MKKNLHFTLWNSLNAIGEVLLLDFGAHWHVLHWNGTPRIRCVVLGARPVPGEVSQLHRPRVAAERTTDKNGYGGLRVLIVAQWFLQQGEHDGALGYEIPESLDGSLSVRAVRWPRVAMLQQGHFIQQGGERFCATFTWEVTDLEWNR